MALSRDATNVLESGIQREFEIVNAEVTFAGSFMQLNSHNDPTAAARGRVDVWNDENDAIPLGWSLAGATGNTTAPAVRNRIGLDPRVTNAVAVTGTGAVSSVGRAVYMTDDNSFTITRPTLGHAIGFVARWITGTTCDVFCFSSEAMYVLGLAGAGTYIWNLGVVGPLSSAGNLATGIQAPHHAQILDFYGIVGRAFTGAGGSSTLNLEIGGTNVTGGVITVTTATGTNGAKLTDTAITAANIVHEGDLIDVEMALGVGFTNGLLNLFAEVETLPGL